MTKASKGAVRTVSTPRKKRDSRIELRLSKDDLARVKARATSLQTSVSDLLRRSVLEELERDGDRRLRTLRVAQLYETLCTVARQSATLGPIRQIAILRQIKRIVERLTIQC